MPIKTIFVILLFPFNNRLKNKTCSIISSTNKFLLNPILPVAQKPHPSAQPTWEETQTVFRSLSYRIKTLSIFNPSSKSISAFAVFLSLDSKISAFISSGHFSFNSSLNCADRVVASFKLLIKSTKTAFFACSRRYFGSFANIFFKTDIFIKINSCYFYQKSSINIKINNFFKKSLRLLDYGIYMFILNFLNIFPYFIGAFSDYFFCL